MHCTTLGIIGLSGRQYHLRLLWPLALPVCLLFLRSPRDIHAANAGDALRMPMTLSLDDLGTEGPGETSSASGPPVSV